MARKRKQPLRFSLFEEFEVTVAAIAQELGVAFKASPSERFADVIDFVFDDLPDPLAFQVFERLPSEAWAVRGVVVETPFDKEGNVRMPVLPGRRPIPRPKLDA